MKKVLFASTALVAFGLAGAAQAADPISLKLGGYSKWIVGYADQDDAFEHAAPSAVTGAGVAYEDLDVQGTNEVYFLGSTTLDNGLKIGVQMELEAGGTTDVTADPIDEAYITVDGGFGRVILGSENNGAYLLHVAAPDAAANFGESEFGINRGNWVRDPVRGAFGAFASTNWTTAINTDNDAAKITYVAPSFAGLTVGASYIPSNEGNPSGDITPIQAEGLSDIWGVAAAYNNSFSGVGVKLSAGWVTIADTDEATSGIESHNEWSIGAQFAYAGFTLGGGYKNIDSETGTGVLAAGNNASLIDGHVWEAGIQYATGPFAVSFAYMTSQQAGTDGLDSTETDREVYQVSGKYNMGPGVDVIATVGHADFQLDGAGAVGNDGWAAMTGLALAF